MKVAGIVYIKADGVQYRAKGEFTWNLGNPLREPIIGSDGVHGFKETPQVAFIEGAVTDDNISVDNLQNITNATVTLELNNGKVISLAEAWYANEGNVTTSESEVPVRFESRRKGQEIR